VQGDDAGERYADHVRAACAAAGGKVSAFFIESGMSVAGVVVPPKGYLQRCYAHVREAGGVCVADEVQVCLEGVHVFSLKKEGAGKLVALLPRHCRPIYKDRPRNKPDTDK
jgi:ethanolamine-phosphate phospho-lyase